MAACLLYALGLMAKPMLVSLPFTLLLLDYWPLKRIRADRLFSRRFFSQAGALAKEKIPLFLLSIATAVITLIVQHKESIEVLPVYLRIQNAAVAYAAYIGKMLYPVNLAVFYPHPGTSLAFWKIAASLILLTTATIVALRKRNTLPYFTFGWLWFLITLLPVIGLVQVGRQAMADRYMYIPSIGLSVLLVWGFHDIIRRHTVERKTAAFGFSAIIICLAFLTYLQNRTWRNSETLFQHAIRVTEDNYVAHNNLGTYYAEKGELETALFHFQTALKIQPRYYDALINISKAYLQQQRTEEALAVLERLRKRRPFTEEVHHLLGDAYRQIGNRQEAVKCFRNAVTLAPASINARMKLAGLHLQQDEHDKAAQQYTKILEHKPAHP
jgi:tetratricopeptide (TPR) repeat protein